MADVQIVIAYEPVSVCGGDAQKGEAVVDESGVDHDALLGVLEQVVEVAQVAVDTKATPHRTPHTRQAQTPGQD